ncbi:MAG: GNAT family N-acetyltransferase [Nocardioidaceae bacterium]
MSDLCLRRFGPEDDDEVDAAIAVVDAASALDSPWERPTRRVAYVAGLRLGWDGDPERCWLATVGGDPVAVGGLTLFERDNPRLAWVAVTVHPDCRRRGYGRVVFDRLVHEARAAGRSSIGADVWETSPGVDFVRRRGLVQRSQAIQRRQHLADVDRVELRRLHDEAAAVAGDYELFRLVGRTPPELVADMVALVAAINDAPTDDLDIEDEVFSPARLATYEESTLAQDNRMYRLVARHRATGALAGHTVVAVEADRPAIGAQHDTAVARGHRGHRLGLLLKTGMLAWLAEAEPQLETIDTWNAESNDHMIEVNERLGYRVVARGLQFQRSW